MKILPTVVREVPVMAPRGPGQLRFGQLNAHNFFDIVDAKSTRDTVLGSREFARHTSKLAAAIRDALGVPDVVTMQEVENIGVLRKLTAHRFIREFGYKPVLLQGSDNRGINNAILYRPEFVTLHQVMQVDPLRSTATGRMSRLYTRPPLVATFGINGLEDARRGVREFTVMSNHFTSKLGGEEAAAKRAQQAEVVAAFAQGLQDVYPRRGLVVAGDLNMERSEPQFAALRTSRRGAALVDATASIPPRDRFTWRDGRAHQQLDHVLISRNIEDHVKTSVIPHVSTQIGKDAASDPVRAAGFSDHDPVVVTFER